jgi:hypothetical protein
LTTLDIIGNTYIKDEILLSSTVIFTISLCSAVSVILSGKAVRIPGVDNSIKSSSTAMTPQEKISLVGNGQRGISFKVYQVITMKDFQVLTKK